MGNKQIGSSAERELIHEFWKNGWTAARVAGSGSMQYPSPDIIASKNGRHLAIECKKTKEKYKYFTKDEIAELVEYAQKSGSEACLAIKFPRENWLFLRPKQLDEKNTSYGIMLEQAKQRGIVLNELIKDGKEEN